MSDSSPLVSIIKNAGLLAAHGEWVCYLDDDNEYQPRKIAETGTSSSRCWALKNA